MEIFTRHDFVNSCMKILEVLCEDYFMKLYAYCFMPDHVHIVMAVKGQKSAIDLIAGFKSVSTKESWKFGFEGKLYQRRFYDRFVRKDEDLKEAVLYVLNNPVRKGIVQKWGDYPYLKCFL
jgi:putative transposase